VAISNFLLAEISGFKQLIFLDILFSSPLGILADEQAQLPRTYGT
jgi:hypothetical protein